MWAVQGDWMRTYWPKLHPKAEGHDHYQQICILLQDSIAGTCGSSSPVGLWIAIPPSNHEAVPPLGIRMQVVDLIPEVDGNYQRIGLVPPGHVDEAVDPHLFGVSRHVPQAFVLRPVAAIARPRNVLVDDHHEPGISEGFDACIKAIQKSAPNKIVVSRHELIGDNWVLDVCLEAVRYSDTIEAKIQNTTNNLTGRSLLEATEGKRNGLWAIPVGACPLHALAKPVYDEAPLSAQG
mmetsp:Transcript_36350/g.65731  ORF Transcript_36350/g.65731 Transcript_36350/m.65731 type:complete len:236 (-) Transcript_36350:178-885(-)